MKVLILTESGKNIGFGHLARCISLYQAFEERGISPRIILNGEPLTNLLEGKDFLIFNWLKYKARFCSLVAKATVVIVDSYLADISLYRIISEKVEIPVYFDDYQRLSYPRGFVVNGSIYAKQQDYPKEKDITYLLGKQYVPLRREFWDDEKKQINGSLKKIMLTFGGSGKGDISVAILRFLSSVYPQLTKNVILPEGFQNIEEIDSLKDKKIRLKYNLDTKEMKGIMLGSDIAITSGGQILYELASVGLPSIGICVAQNQLANVKSWKRLGFLEYIGWYNDKNLLENLKNKMEYLRDLRVRQAKSGIGRKSIDRKGALRIVKTILSGYFKRNFSLRRAVFKDAPSLFYLANEDIVRNFSFHPRKINWGKHLKWYREKLSNENCVFFIFNIKNSFCGQLRFDLNLEKKEAVVNISFTKEVRGVDLSSFALKTSINALLKIHKYVQVVKAYVKHENVPSIKMFEHANFVFSKNIIINGNKARMYIKKVASGV